MTGDPAAVSRPRRLSGLDGLRGLAALTVLVHHCLLVSSSFADGYEGGRPTGWAWWIVHSPLNSLIGRPGSVLVFFVVSGFVLTAASLGRRVDWTAYYAKRGVRLLLPMWASVMVAVVVISTLAPRDTGPGASWWVAAHDVPVTVPSVLLHLLPVTSTPPWLNSPLWTLRLELLFSLLLPLAVWLAVRMRRWSLPASLVCVLLVALASHAAVAEAYLGAFGIGALMAADRERLDRVLAALGCRGWWVALGASLVAINGSWWFPFLGGYGVGLALVGAAGVVVLFLSDRVEPFTGSRVVRWLGSRSFSIYLVHEIVLFGVLAIVGETASVALVVALTVPLALLAGEVFWRAVESPTTTLARRVGRRVGRRGRPSGAGRPAADGDRQERRAAPGTARTN